MKIHNTNKKKFLITIAGPTAVGKTSLCIDIAKNLNCEIFSCDSRQVYKEMSIGTAKPTTEELESTTHHFIDHLSIHDHYSAGHFERDFDQKILAYFQENDIAILTGGTGMYIKAAQEGLDNFPDIDEATKQKVRQIFEDGGIDSLADNLRQYDPTYALSVDLKNKRRLTRALEVCIQTGNPFSEYLNKKSKIIDFECINICLTRPRENLYNRINQRVDTMMKEGLEEEARALYIHKGIKALDTVGYRELFSYFDGEYSKERAIELIKQNTRRYAKRQMTWFKNQGAWKMIQATELDEIHQYINTSIS